jgi:hypothetical protein
MSASFAASHIADLGDGSAAEGGRARHAPSRHNKLANAIGCIPRDRRQKIWKDPEHRWKISGAVAHRPNERDDRCLPLVRE